MNIYVGADTPIKLRFSYTRSLETWSYQMGFIISFGVYGFDKSLVKSYNVYEISKDAKYKNKRANYITVTPPE